MVSVDLYLNETTRRADVILPVPSPLERPHYDLAFTTLAVRNTARFSPTVFPTDAPSEVELLLRLALIAAGKGADADPAPFGELLLGGMLQSYCADEASPVAGRDPRELQAELGDRPLEERMLDAMLRCGVHGDGFASPGSGNGESDGLSLAKLEAHPEGIDFGPLQPRLADVLQTPSGRIELAADSLGADLARLRLTLDVSGGRPRFQLVGRRHVRSNNSWMHNLPSLVSGKPRCTLEIHPDDAGELGLARGDRARVRSAAGELEVDVEPTADIRRGVVSLPHGWGHDLPGARLTTAAAHAGVNSNTLTDCGPIDPLSGNAELNGIPVLIERAP
jgi:anaerobic selenocysteine-containing dehydrogenase